MLTKLTVIISQNTRNKTCCTSKTNIMFYVNFISIKTNLNKIKTSAPR